MQVKSPVIRSYSGAIDGQKLCSGIVLAFLRQYQANEDLYFLTSLKIVFFVSFFRFAGLCGRREYISLFMCSFFVTLGFVSGRQAHFSRTVIEPFHLSESGFSILIDDHAGLVWILVDVDKETLSP